MSRRRPNAKQLAFVSGRLPEQMFKIETHATQFERLLARLKVSEATCHLNEQCAAWCRANKNRRFIPESVLRRLSAKTMYEEPTAPYSLISGTVIPEPELIEV